MFWIVDPLIPKSVSSRESPPKGLKSDFRFQIAYFINPQKLSSLFWVDLPPKPKNPPPQNQRTKAPPPQRNHQEPNIKPQTPQTPKTPRTRSPPPPETEQRGTPRRFRARGLKATSAWAPWGWLEVHMGSSSSVPMPSRSG